MTQKDEKRSESRSSAVLIRMSPIQKILLKMAAREKGITVNDFLMELAKPSLNAQIQHLKVELGATHETPINT